MARGIFPLLFCAILLRAQTLDDSARELAKNISARLASNEIAHVITRNQSSLSHSDTLHAQSIFEQAMRRRVRNPSTVELNFTISENLKGVLLIASFDRGEERIVEMIPYRPDAAPAPARPPLAIVQRLLWEQPAPILDLAAIADSGPLIAPSSVPSPAPSAASQASSGDELLVLDPATLTRYQRRDGKWIAAESAPLTIAGAPAPIVRDPRGRLTIDADSVTVEVAGVICHGSWKLSLAITCQAGGEISSGRNTIDPLPRDSPSQTAEPQATSQPAPFFSEARIGPARIAAEIDGHARVYDSGGAVSRVIDNWGSDLAAIDTCAGPRVIVTAAVPAAASGASERDVRDAVTLFDFIHSVPIRVSEPAELPGPVTALWPSKDGALAVVRDLATGKYEAYGISADCGH